MPLAALLLIMAATMLTLAEDLYNTSQLGQVTRKQEVYGLQVNDSFLIKGPFWYPRSASRNYLLLSDSRGFATWGQLPDTLPTQHHFTNRVTAQYFAIDTMLFTKHLTSGVVKTTTGGGVYVDTIPPNWCDSIANCINEQAWGLTGNSGTTAGTNFIGTTDSKSLYFKTKNTTAIVVDTNQNVGIGTATPSLGLEIQGKGFATQSIDMFGFSEITHYSPGHVIVIQTYGSQNYLGSAIAMDTFGVFSLSSKRVNISANDTLNLSISGTEATGYVLTSDASGNATWSPTAFTPSDSVTIYALTPTAGTVYFCTDCTGNGFTGHPVYYAASMWRRWD